MGNLSDNFSRHEFACHCGCGKDEVSMLLVESLQQLRNLIGKPIYINSGVRCAKHNREVGGSPTSQHLLGKAADIRVHGMAPVELYKLARKIEAFNNGGIGVYPDQGFIHVDVRGSKARWAFLRGHMTSLAEAMKEAEG